MQKNNYVITQQHSQCYSLVTGIHYTPNANRIHKIYQFYSLSLLLSDFFNQKHKMCFLNSWWCVTIRCSVTAISSKTHEPDTSPSKCHSFLCNVTGWPSGSSDHLSACQLLFCSCYQKYQLATDSRKNTVTSLMECTSSSYVTVSRKVSAFSTTVHLPFALQNAAELINQLPNAEIMCSNPFSPPLPKKLLPRFWLSKL